MKKNKNKKKKKKKEKKDNFLLDTSVQIKKLINSTLYDELRLLKNSGKELNSSFFILYEFKTGFIATLIEFYLFVKVHSKFPESIAEWSNTFKPRKLKYTTILESLMLCEGDISNDKDKYLNQIEARIYFILTNFETDLKNIVGDFQSDEIVKYEILGKESYKGFLDRHTGRKKCIPMTNFWSKHEEDLKILINGVQDYDTEGLQKIHERLVKINNDIMECEKQQVNNGIGDAVIAVDCPKSYILASFDHSFDVLCKKIDKKNVKFF